jgi:hypothetical protein
MGTGLGGAGWLGLWEAYRQALELGQLDGYQRRRWQRGEELAGCLAEGELPSLSTKQALALYRASGGRQTEEFQSNPIGEVRDSLDFLLYDAVKLEGRFEECASQEGAFKLAGAGKEFVSYLLCLREPTLFAVWSPHCERALRRLGMYPEGLRKGNLGMRYMDLLEASESVRRRVGLADFRAVDEFAYAVTRAGARAAR